MKPYYQDDYVTIYHGDCRDIVPTLGAFDLLLTDPPYGAVNRKSNGLRVLDKGIADVAFDGQCELIGKIKAKSAYVFCGTEQISEIRKMFADLGRSTRLCIWEKTNPSPMNGEHLWLSSVEACVYAKEEGACFNAHCESPVWRGPTVITTKHPTEKPEWLFKRLIITSTNSSGTVLDPFAGSGTTGRSAKDLNRNATLIEIEERYCEIAAKRMGQEVFQFNA